MKVAIEDECYISCSRKKKTLDLTWIPQNINFLANNNIEPNLTLQCQTQCLVQTFNSSRCQPRCPAPTCTAVHSNCYPLSSFKNIIIASCADMTV